MKLIDTHCHLNDERLLGDAERIVNDFGSDGIECAVCVGYDLPSSVQAVALARKYADVYAAVGIHPHDSKDATEQAYAAIAALCEFEKTVAVGEIGLDYFYDFSPRDVQKEVFIKQLELAHSLKLPVVLHVRDAYEDTRDILFQNQNLLSDGVVLHCYSGSAEMVKIFDRLDVYYSFGGAITFKGAKHNVEALSAVPENRLLLETDCPYMTPVPFRGKTNEPKYIGLVAEKAAQVRGLTLERLKEITACNTKALFKRLKQ
jgi:TatD DNase family protein